MAGLKNIVGGEIKGYTELLTESRNQATDRMVEHHSIHAWRVWKPEELAAWLNAQGLEDVRVGAKLARPDEPPQGEDVFVHAFLPR